jgi:hypothetical protein
MARFGGIRGALEALGKPGCPGRMRSADSDRQAVDKLRLKPKGPADGGIAALGGIPHNPLRWRSFSHRPTPCLSPGSFFIHGLLGSTAGGCRTVWRRVTIPEPMC